jgi:predicted DsbA family dithiol-disulfide isomerase
VRYAPFLLDPTTPPEGKPRRQYTKQGDGPTPIEQRAETLGIRFSRGREWTSSSLLALEAAEFVGNQPPDVRERFHRQMFKAYFDELADIGNQDVVLQVAEEAGVATAELAAALERGEFRQQLVDGLQWSRAIGVTAVPTFIFDERLGVVGAQPLEVLEEALLEVRSSPGQEYPN